MHALRTFSNPMARVAWKRALALVLTLVPCRAAWSQQGAERFGAGFAYPRISLASGYEVDASWPRERPQAGWGEVSGIAVDQNNHVWVFHRGKDPVQEFSPDGRLLRAWGEGQFQKPHQIRLDRQGNLWLVDTGLHVVRKCTPDGRVLMTLGTPGEPGDDSAHFNQPTDVAIAPDGELFVSDGYGNNRVVHFDGQGRFLGNWGRLGVAVGEFSLPHAIVLDGRNRVYVADRNNARIQVFDRAGRVLDEWRNLMVPWQIVLTTEGDLLVCGSSPMRWPRLPIPGLPLGIPPKDQLVMRFSADGRVRDLWTFPKPEGAEPKAGELDWVHGMAIDQEGNLYLGDIQGHRVQKFRRLNGKAPETLAGPKAAPRDPSVNKASKQD